MQPGLIELNGSSFYYRSYGEGPCVVLVHGFGEDGRIWEPMAAQLTGCRILVPDLPGSGRSEMTADMSMEGMAQSLHGMLQQENVSSCILIGHSMGGYISLAFLERYPQMVTGTGLFHSSTFADSEEKKATRQKGIAFIREHGAFRFQETTIPNLYAPQTRETRKELVQQHIDSVRDVTAEALIAYYRAMMARPDRTNLLRQNKIPWLFVLGRYDNAFPVSDSLQQAHQPARTQVHLLEASGHMGMMEEPEQSLNLLQTFIATTSLS